jgi:hypothetical protein
MEWNSSESDGGNVLVMRMMLMMTLERTSKRAGKEEMQ